MKRRVWITRDNRGDGAEFDCYSIWRWRPRPIFLSRETDEGGNWAGFGGCWVGRDSNEKEMYFEGLIAGDLCPRDFRGWTGYSMLAGEIKDVILDINITAKKEAVKCRKKK